MIDLDRSFEDETRFLLPENEMTLSGTSAVSEGGTITYVASLSRPADEDMTVTLSNGAVIVIPQGSQTGSVDVPVADDPYASNGENT
ncbi:MAG: hypothetical protein MI808_13155, partial [Pseudomonadales bacterium]|nr:hypothetical protein [Pseudomonadales bacterium]